MTLLFQPMALPIDLAFLIALKAQGYCTIAKTCNRQRNDLFIDLINGNYIDVLFKRFILRKCCAVEQADDQRILNVPGELIQFTVQRLMDASCAKLN